jgi:hypothetical protein
MILMATQSESKKSKKEEPMKNGMISRALTTTRTLELEYREPSFSLECGIGVEPPTPVEGMGERPLLDELAGFATAIWAWEKVP